MLLHVDLFVQSIDNMLEFYVNKLGMKVVDDTIISGDIVKFVSQNRYDTYRITLLKMSKIGSMIELIEYIDNNNGPYIPKSPTTVTLLVSSIDMKIKQLENKRITPTSEIFHVQLPNVGKSKIVFYEDPEKNMVELLQME